MFHPKRWQFTVVASVLLCTAGDAEALVLFGPDTGGATNNLQPPPNGAPWQYVANVGVNNASGVYLGNGYVITANHVTGFETASVSISGSIYPVDQSYTPSQIGTADIKLFRIIGDPQLPMLPLIRANDSDTGRDATMIGWGVGKGSEVPNQGWNWAGDDTRAERWGLNRTDTSYTRANGLEYLTVAFDRPGQLGGSSFGDDEASLSIGDSGSALFINSGNVWRLAGIASLVDTPGQSLYDRDATLLFDQSGRSYYTPMKAYRNEITAAVPEPSGWTMLFAAGAALVGYIRPRSR